MNGLVHLLIALNLTSEQIMLSDIHHNFTIEKIAKTGCGIGDPIHVPNNPTKEGHAEFGEFPWTVSINGSFEFAGVLIHPQVVLTVSHNQLNIGRPVKAGKWDIDRDIPGFPSQTRISKKVIVLPDVDLALVFLGKPFTLAPHINTICLPKTQENMENVKNCYETSWGYDRSFNLDNLLRKMPRATMRFDKCQELIQSSQLGQDFRLSRSYLCAGNLEGVHGCMGDGGGPLSCPIPNGDGRYQLGGVDAWGPNAENSNQLCTSKYLPLGYTSAAKYRDWIDQQMFQEGYDTSFYIPPDREVSVGNK